MYRNLLHFYKFTMKDQREIKRTIPLNITTKRIKYIGINLPTETKNLYSKNMRH